MFLNYAVRRDQSGYKKGGRIEGLKVLNSFYIGVEKSMRRRCHLQQPLRAVPALGLSAFGTLSMREVFQACEAQ